MLSVKLQKLRLEGFFALIKHNNYVEHVNKSSSILKFHVGFLKDPCTKSPLFIMYTNDVRHSLDLIHFDILRMIMVLII